MTDAKTDADLAEIAVAEFDAARGRFMDRRLTLFPDLSGTEQACWIAAVARVREALAANLAPDRPRRVVWAAADGVVARITVPANAWTFGEKSTVLSLDGDVTGEFVSSRVLGVTGTDAEGPDAGPGGKLQAAADALQNAADALEATDE